eukprot:scaffold3827_cov179-Cylindrotheca_fusiformis.AAC.23
MATTGVNHNSVIESALATLQPLKDLSRNWDVDIALEEYLHELGAGDLVGQVPADDNHSDGQTPNFARAALILQNSSSVYTRKVDYLHKLVYKALLEFCKNESSARESSRRKSADSDIEEFYEFDPHIEFLLLDDVVPEDLTNQKINLKSDEIDEYHPSCSTPNQSGMTSRNRTRLSLGGLSVTKLERSITGGFTSSAQQRALLGTINNGSLRLVGGRCDVGDNGVLLMPGSSMLTPVTGDMAMDDSQQPRRSLFREDSAGEASTAPPSNDFGSDSNDYDDHSNDGAGFEMNFGDDAAVDATEQYDVVGAAFQQQRKRVTFAEVPKNKKRMDPWALLDPHTSDGRKPKPLRKAKTIGLPTGLDRLPSECVTGARTRHVMQRPRLSQPDEDLTARCLATDTFRSFLRNQAEPPKIPISGLVFKEFTYIAKQKSKERAQERLIQRKKEAKEQNICIAQEEDVYDDDDDGGDFGGFDFGGGDHDDEDNDGDCNDGGNAGFASFEEAFQHSSQDDHHGTSNMGKTFEDLCRAHIQAFAKGAEEFAFNTHLSARVDKWQAKLVPILEEEERRSVFDIHAYSQRLIESAELRLQRERLKRKSDGSMQAVTTLVQFETVTEHCSQSDVCRMFLASLSLANSGNLSICEGSDSFCFDLVSNDLEHPMDCFTAPSLLEGQ